MINYYFILEVPENAAALEIKKAFKRLAIKHHPDKNGGNEEMFKRINTAYQILSNPTKRQHYDNQRLYEKTLRQPPQRRGPPPSHQYAPYRPPSYRKYRHRRSIDPAQERWGTMLAFAFVFAIALLVVTGVQVKKMYVNHQMDQIVEEQQAKYTIARQLYNKGNYQEAIEMMRKIILFPSTKPAIRAFKKNVVDSTMDKGFALLQRGKIQEGILLLEIAVKYKSNSTLRNRIKKYIAENKKATGNMEGALAIYQGFLAEGFDLINSLINIAEIHQNHYQDKDAALQALITAHEVATGRYKKFYGKGYPLVIEAKHIPPSHYTLYTYLARLYLQTNNPTMAIKAAEWNKYVWPDSLEHYVVTAEAYMALHKTKEGCGEFNIARGLGWNGDMPNICND